MFSTTIQAVKMKREVARDGYYFHRKIFILNYFDPHKTDLETRMGVLKIALLHILRVFATNFPCEEFHSL